MTGLDSLIAELKAGHAERNPRSAAAFESALRVMPGGNSRTQLYFEPFPFYVDHAERCIPPRPRRPLATWMLSTTTPA